MISYTVFGKHKVPFKHVFDAAQEQLRKKFGMEMIELPLKEKVTERDRRGNS
jgi:melanoma-associated antigen